MTALYTIKKDAVAQFDLHIAELFVQMIGNKED